MLADEIEECAECVDGKPYESVELRLELECPYMFRGVMSDWLMATIPRLASRASLKCWRSASDAVLSLLLMSIREPCGRL